MRRTTFMASLLLAVLLLAGCNGKKNDATVADGDTATQATQITDTTVYGICTDGAMNSFGLKQDDGKVLQLVEDQNDSLPVVYGGLLDGDELAVTYYADKQDQMNIATRVINLTTLRAHWQSLDRDFQLLKGGQVQSNQQGETHPWVSWSIYNGHLLLNKDTFDITLLSADSLYLENDYGIYTFARAKDKTTK